MLRSLPMAFPLGLVIESIDERHCRVRLPYRPWLRNPFRSLFWAVMGMAAELCSGALVYAYASGTGCKFILAGVSGRFHRKVTGKSFYICEAGDVIRKHLQDLTPLADTTIDLPVVVHDASGEIVADFVFTWQLRAAAARM
jgi:acyl-coenzyme A thioesterase PaaI-like protein